jgi:penicillin-binding protein 1A
MATSKQPKNVNKGKKAAAPHASRGAWFWVSNALSAFIWAVIAVGAVLGYFALTLPDVDDVVATTRRQPIITVQDAQGGTLVRVGALYGPAVSVADLPPALPAAIIAVEDRRFYRHSGLDLRGFARAMLANARAGAVVQGGSTITQQVAKNLFLTPERTVARKVREALLALWLEQKFTKEQILTLYLNRVYLGSGTYGVEAAAHMYFNRSARDLTVYQSAMLAGLMKAPSRYNPKTDDQAARDRTQIVLQAMVDTGVLTDAQARAAEQGASIDIAAAPSGTARYFADWVLSTVEDLLGSIENDLIVRTTLDSDLQAIVESRLEQSLAGADRSVGQGAVVVLQPDGAVRALAGGRSYAESQFNRAVQARRQPGSAFKPFVFLAGLEAGFVPTDTVEDAPINIDGWRPQNFSGTYAGPTTLEDALANSLNSVAVRVAREAGPDAVIDVARRFGIESPLSNDLGLALGTAEVSLLELTAAYTPFANGGIAVVPYGIVDIVTPDGRLLYKRQGGGIGRVAAPDHIGMMNRMMSKTISDGTGKAAQISRPAAGKTGTSQDFRDAWFIGYTADLVAGVWVGNDDAKGMSSVTGGGMPAAIWREIMLAAHRSKPAVALSGWTQPDEVDPLTRFWRRLTGG